MMLQSILQYSLTHKTSTADHKTDDGVQYNRSEDNVNTPPLTEKYITTIARTL